MLGTNAALPRVEVIPLTGAIGPARADFFSRSLAQAQKDQAQLVVLEMDTPGGLDVSMRQIIQAILASPVPVASFIAPSGARAASAGTYILYASHIAAMAPGTNLGAATPVQIGMGGAEPSPGKAPNEDKSTKAASGGAESQSTMERKQVNDAAAYIRGLAQLRGRNEQWAEHAVREAVSLSANEALAQRVIDLTARDLPDLLQKLDGRKVSTAAGERVLHTAGAMVVTIEPSWRDRFLAAVTDPSVALILMMIGMYGLFFEFSSPGYVLPGLAGAICLLVGLYALQMLPINYTGLALVLLGLGCLLAEAFLPTFGTLGVGGIVAFSIGALMLINTDVPGLGIPPGLIAALAAVTGLFVFGVSGMVLKSRRRPVVSGGEQLAHQGGELLDDLPGGAAEGWALVQGERWRVRSAMPLPRGSRVRVVGRDGLVLIVVPDDKN
ncbi:nodulation protein NfeD [Crenobacter sp. SG2303]|uniref:Nodulation protein NfeD n=1 Tax=Crenobacter oryzisoli TaxID=3056844 RepID=A0ABT7XV74_9NEIS|nr:nodulation protein NfeD [Crenobacter sp. SG2303]MDN0077701.1 nodulation protein NfeD [Crenobacter sp. SG2303]